MLIVERIRDAYESSPIRRGFIDLLSASFAIQFLGFGTLLLIPRFVSPEELGDLKVLQSWINLFAIAAGFGFNTAVLKLCAEERPDADRQSILVRALGYTLVACAVMFLFAWVLSLLDLPRSTDRVQSWLLVYALVLPFDAVTNLFAAYLQALKRIRDLARAQLIVKAQAVLVIVFATWRFGFGGFVVATVVGYAIGLLPFVVRIGTETLRSRRSTTPEGFWSLSTFSWLANAVNTLGRHADIYVLGLFYHNPRDLGYYALAKIVVSGANVVTSTAQRIALPYLSAASSDERRFRKLAISAQWQTAVLAIAAAVVVHAAALLLIRYFYAEDYATAIRYLDILLLRYVLWSAFAIVGVATIAIGRPEYNLAGASIATPLSLLLTWWMLRSNGTIGVAYAQVISAAATFVLTACLYRLAVGRYFRRSG